MKIAEWRTVGTMTIQITDLAMLVPIQLFITKLELLSLCGDGKFLEVTLQTDKEVINYLASLNLK